MQEGVRENLCCMYTGPAQHGKHDISYHRLENCGQLHPYLSAANPDTKAHLLLFHQQLVSTLWKGQWDKTMHQRSALLRYCHSSFKQRTTESREKPFPQTYRDRIRIKCWSSFSPALLLPFVCAFLLSALLYFFLSLCFFLLWCPSSQRCKAALFLHLLPLFPPGPLSPNLDQLTHSIFQSLT